MDICLLTIYVMSIKAQYLALFCSRFPSMLKSQCSHCAGIAKMHSERCCVGVADYSALAHYTIGSSGEVVFAPLTKPRFRIPDKVETSPRLPIRDIKLYNLQHRNTFSSRRYPTNSTDFPDWE